MNASNDNNDPALSDEAMEDLEQTQSTQQASQPSSAGLDAHLWGYLQPCSASLTRIDFWKINPRYTIGRNTEQNQVVLPGLKVSNLHCSITWDGSEDNGSVVVNDYSSNGTFINNVKIGKNQTRVLKEGNEIAFGTCLPQPQNSGLEDYRFIYRHTAKGPPTTGLYAFYDITQELGKGSFAVVMKAVSRATGKWYAVKMIQESRHVRSPGERQYNDKKRKTFAREISILESLNHRNICQLKEVFYEESGDINLVLELVEGGDLLDYILRHGGLDEASAKHLTYQLCDALAHIHSRNVTHRDLKPENVLLTNDDPPIVKVADFGLAKVVDSLTMLRTMCGTPSYLAPEVVKQEMNEGYDSVVDSWSVGVILFSMLTNSSPFIEDEAQQDIRTRIAERSVDWSCLERANISLEGEHFVRCLLEEDPRRRMTMKDALEHPWLLSYTPVYGPGYLPSSHNIPSDDSFRNVMSEGFQNLHIQGSIIPQSMQAMPGMMREDSRTAPLQRRSHLLSQAAEDGKALLEPSFEMVENANLQESSGAGPSNGHIKGQKKRVYSELSPLPEEGFIDAAINGSSPLSDVDSIYDRKASDEDSGGKESALSGKMKGKLATTSIKKNSRARVAKGGDMSEEEPAQPRRSGRHPKVARHA